MYKQIDGDVLVIDIPYEILYGLIIAPDISFVDLTTLLPGMVRVENQSKVHCYNE